MPPRFHALIDRIHRRGYETVQQTVMLSDLSLSFVRIADADRVLDRVAEEEDRLQRLGGKRAEADQLRLPYWAELWDSALAIGQKMSRDSVGKTVNSGISVLDLGCGMGLTGTVAARLGLRVLFADLEGDALLFARLNSLADAARVRTRRLDWRSDRLAESFDLIVGADILYERRQWDFLEPFWRAHLNPRGRVLLGEPGRQTGDAFIDWIKTRGWSLQVCHETVPARQVRILELTVAHGPAAVS